jgi:hypothetical protein
MLVKRIEGAVQGCESWAAAQTKVECWGYPQSWNMHSTHKSDAWMAMKLHILGEVVPNAVNPPMAKDIMMKR